MKGKKVDSEFLEKFITECVKCGIDTPQEIAARARSIILDIDNEIKRLEQRKIIRSKLLDVINTFDKQNKQSKFEGAKILDLYKIQNPLICKFICDNLNKESIDKLTKTNYPSDDVLFCIKQLIEHNIIVRSGSKLTPGTMYNEYMRLIFGKTS